MDMKTIHLNKVELQEAIVKYYENQLKTARNKRRELKNMMQTSGEVHG